MTPAEAGPTRRALLAITGAIDPLLTLADRAFVLLAGVALAVSLVMNIANLAARNMLGRGLPPVFSWTMVLFVWMVFLSFYPIYRRRIDIAVDVIVRRMPESWQFAMRLATDALGILVVGVIVAEGPRVLETQVGTIDFVGLERYVLSIPLLASSALIAVDFLMDALHALAGQEPPHLAEEGAQSLH